MALQRAIYQLIYVEDAFAVRGANVVTPQTGVTVTVNTRWEFKTNAEKAKAFREWLDEQIRLGILSVDAGGYIESAYKKAKLDAWIALHPEATAKSMDFYAGTRAAFLESSFASATAQSQIELLATRAYENLKGVTQEMATKMNRIASDAMAHGHSPAKMASALRKQVGISKARAETIARTELGNAYSEGQLDSFEEMNVEEVGVYAEWSTAGDDRVCPQCQPLEGQVFTIEEARGILPRHPNCRCAWIPAIESQKNRKRDAMRAAARSVKSEEQKGRVVGGERKYKDPATGQFTLDEPATSAKETSKWKGADL